jgi:diguanylate cyclase
VSGEPVLLLTLLQIPFYLFTMSVAARRSSGMLITTMKAERENSYRARHDVLTRLPDRTGFFEAAGRDGAARIKPGMTLLYLDFDGFKPVNGAYGHEAGDALLAQAAQRLREQAGSDALVARMGGDVFVILTTCQGARGRENWPRPSRGAWSGPSSSRLACREMWARAWASRP